MSFTSTLIRRLPTKPIPLSAIPSTQRILPAALSSSSSSSKKSSTSSSTPLTTSPTIDRLLSNLTKNSRRPKGKGPLGRVLLQPRTGTGLAEDGRGLGSLTSRKQAEAVDDLNSVLEEAGEEGSEGTEEAALGQLPPNLRIEEFVEAREEYRGIKAKHRDLLKRLRREA